LQVNRYLVAELQALGLWTEAMRARLKLAEGSLAGIEGIPEELREVYRTAWEIPMRSLIDMAAERGAFIDQSQSLNLFVENPNIARLSSMYFYAWQRGLKTTYYLRSRPATRIAKATVSSAPPPPELGADPHGERGWTPAPPLVEERTDEAAVTCSLENPETCEACQ
jgi:ribonucleoside-diphosphate reductase alpha chain